MLPNQGSESAPKQNERQMLGEVTFAVFLLQILAESLQSNCGGCGGFNMPNFSNFSTRLSQTLNPMNRQPNTGPMFEGEMPLPANINNPMSMTDRPQGQDGAIPLVQDQPASGRKFVDRIKENVASQVRYEDIAPKMEVEPTTPEFEAKPTKGVWNHLKAGFQAAGGASRMYPNRPLAPLVGAIAGAVDPRIAQVMDYQGRVVPEAQRKQAEVRQRNTERQKAFQAEIQSRTAVAKMNEANQPDYAPVPGSEFQTLYNKHNPDDTKTLKDAEGKPLRNASVANAETSAESREEIARKKALADQERDVEKKKHDFEMAKVKHENTIAIEKMREEHRREIEAMRQDGQNKRADKAEGGRNARADKAEAGKDRRVKMRRGDDDEPEEKRPANIFLSPQFRPNSFDWKPMDQPIGAPSSSKRKMSAPQ
mgnify:CR=1 FL=1